MDEQILIEGTYQIIREIGSGSGGTVFLAYHKRLEKNVVLKKIRTSAQKLLDIRTEADILKNLHHPNLPQVFDFIKTVDNNGDSVIYTVMDFIPGKSFEDLLKEGATFTPTQVAKYTVQLCNAIQYLHSQQPPILHGDIKPANVMLMPDDNICLIDFNISGFSDDLEVVGFTRGYASPEQCQAAFETRERRKQAAQANAFKAETNQSDGDDVTVLADEDETVIHDDRPASPANSVRENGKANIRIDQRSDIFSIGATAYCLLLGKKPDAVYENQVPISRQNIKVSDGLAFVIDKAMQLEPKNRFQTVSEMIRALSTLGKKDKRYKRLVLKQALFCTLFIILASISAITAYSGYRIMREDRADQNYEHALALYESREYDETLKYILSEALGDESIYNTETLGNLYYLAAESYFETEEYDSAVGFYEKALKCNSASVEYYCNYAIALVRLDRIDLATSVIESAVRLGISSDKLNLMQGELAAASGNLAEAEQNFRECITQTNDSYVLARAYIMFSDLYEKSDGYSTNTSLIEKNIEILTEARSHTEKMYLPIILERLMQAYADFAELSGNDAYIQYAIGACRELLDLGWGTFANYMNLALMYSEIKQYETSKAVYGEMIQKFGDNYRIYKRLAFVELEIQGARDIAEREYDVFKGYYDRAAELFAASGESKDSDTEMQLLEESYRSVKDGGWFD